MIFSLWVAPRAKRTALMQASVPELTKRILSILGIIWSAKRAISVSSSVGIPKEVPRSARSFTASITGAKA
jgi:hypothetical protein